MTDQTHPSTHPWDDKSAQWYIDHYGNEPVHKIVPMLCQLQDRQTIVDLGCGSGSVVSALAQQLSTGKVIGIDPTPKMIEVARDHLAKCPAPFAVAVEFYQTGAECLPLLDNSIDIAVAVSSLHHWGEVNTGLAEIMRVLKPQGRLVVIDEIWEEFAADIHTIIDQHGVDFEHMDHHDEFKTAEGVAAALVAAGFAEVSHKQHRQPKIAVSVVTGYKAATTTDSRSLS